jgi:hypothetical protein
MYYKEGYKTIFQYDSNEDFILLSHTVQKLWRMNHFQAKFKRPAKEYYRRRDKKAGFKRLRWRVNPIFNLPQCIICSKLKIFHISIKQYMTIFQEHHYFIFNNITYFKKRCLYCVVWHTASKVTITRVLPLLSIPNYSLTPTVSFISGLINSPVHNIVWYQY